MSNHVTEWMNAYLDGELHGSRLQEVEVHLEKCDVCQSELASLGKLSDFLQGDPAAEFSPPERFAAQVSLRLPHQKTGVPRKRIVEIGWWMIPMGLLAIWILINASFFIYEALSAAKGLGLLTSVSDWLRLGTWTAADWSDALGQLGFLRGNWLDLAKLAETFTRTSFLQITLQFSIAVLYLSWIAIWWTRNQRQGYVQPLEG